MENKDKAALPEKKPSSNPIDIFIVGARKGWNIGVNNLVPNILMAYVIAYILNLLGVMDFLGSWFGPVMALWGLPGQALVVLLTIWLSSSAGVGVAASMYAGGLLTAEHITVLMPAFILMGAQLQYMGRLLGTADVEKRYWPLLMAISIFNALAAMFVMRLLMVFF